ncbi:uncharacterized protein LOC120282794 [Dioscorea cayenensis subsp. rotundata]|uniref:Uncharacterized protein LOC120282794 n=1 Tax=Dioscorea cayennensis subsp. rotundata TaxID=55577 RepID=A0AB40D5N1_DIOCR|nr:uncharacterized protein LOC120282794 [Dioscorea cayenensis subsp. rotundata]
MIDKIKTLCSRCKTYKLSSTAKSILIRSSILSIPTYVLSAYPIPDSVLQEISKLVRDLFWFKGGNGKGIHAVNWSCITDKKSEGGLGHRNLAHAKVSLMAKNVFKYLNLDNIYWVNIARLKYGRLNFWTDSISGNCSLIFRGICRTTKILNQNLWIKNFNPTQTSFLLNPWLFEIPLAFKPTFLIVDIDLNAIGFSELIDNGLWSHSKLVLVFGNLLGSLIPSLCDPDYISNNFWVWHPQSSNEKISSVVSHHLNHNPGLSNEWLGWSKLCKLHVAARVKHFIWLVLHGKISTSDFLNSINIGPETL